MIDDVIIFIDTYLIWVAVVIGCYKILHLIFYKGFHPRYIATTYFVILSGGNVSGLRSYSQRLRFRQVHNLLTIIFYSSIAAWSTIHFVLRGSFI